MKRFLCSFPVLLAFTLAIPAAASAQTAPDTRTVTGPPENGSAIADGTALIAAPAHLNSAPRQVPEPIAASVLPVTCYSTCQDGSSGVGTCNGTLAFCCAANRRLYCAHFGGGYLSGYCTDGTSSLNC